MKLRKLLKITSRSSSITNSFVQAIIPSVEPTKEQVDEALAVLGMTVETIHCIYCGARSTDWDHLRPLVKGRRPTGYINEIKNLVPSCGPCNQSKSGADWRSWMHGSAKGSPRVRKIADLESRVARLDAFEKWGNVKPIPFADLVGPQEWADFWGLLTDIDSRMHNAQRIAVIVRQKIANALDDLK